jgi:hypothetical protein
MGRFKAFRRSWVCHSFEAPLRPQRYLIRKNRVTYFLAREGGGGGGPFLTVAAFARFAKLPCEVAGETDLSPYDRSGLLLLSKVDSSWSLKMLPSVMAGSTVRRLERVVLIVRESLGMRERRGAATGDISRRN